MKKCKKKKKKSEKVMIKNLLTNPKASAIRQKWLRKCMLEGSYSSEIWCNDETD